MSLSIAFAGTLNIQLSEEARPTPVPVNFNLSYTEKVMYDFSFPGSVTHQAVPQGSVTAPRFMLVWVREGAIDLSWSSTGDAPTSIAANPTPPPADTPVLLLMRHAPGASQLYVTTTSAARGAIWIFE